MGIQPSFYREELDVPNYQGIQGSKVNKVNLKEYLEEEHPWNRNPANFLYLKTSKAILRSPN
jgi:hypothetical protein